MWETIRSMNWKLENIMNRKIYDIYKVKDNGKSCNVWWAMANDINWIFALLEGYSKNAPNAEWEVREK